MVPATNCQEDENEGHRVLFPETRRERKIHVACAKHVDYPVQVEDEAPPGSKEGRGVWLYCRRITARNKRHSSQPHSWRTGQSVRSNFR